MSMNKKVSVVCPKCGKLHEITVWSVITAADSKDLKKDLLSGRINILRCEDCGQTALLPDTLLYHDEEKRLLISFTPCADEGKKEQMLEKLKESFLRLKEEMKLDNYNLRFVSEYNSFLEKILIFDNGLNDKVCELIKLLILSQEPEKEDKRAAVFGKREEDELEFLIRDMSDGMCYTSRVPMTTYDTLYNGLAQSGIKFRSFGWEEIDSDYAARMLRGMNNNF